jgi:hypothetical protein
LPCQDVAPVIIFQLYSYDIVVKSCLFICYLCYVMGATFASQARAAGHESANAESGPWLFTLDFPSYYPVMTHAKNRSVSGE